MPSRILATIPLVPLALQEPTGAAARLALGPDPTRYLFACGILVLSIAGLGWALRRLFGGAARARAARRSLAVLDVLPLGGKKTLAVVRCYDRTFALGIGEKEVGLIAELEVETASIPAARVAQSKPRKASLAAALAERAKALRAEILAPRAGAKRPEPPKPSFTESLDKLQPRERKRMRPEARTATVRTAPDREAPRGGEWLG